MIRKKNNLNNYDNMIREATKTKPHNNQSQPTNQPTQRGVKESRKQANVDQTLANPQPKDHDGTFFAPISAEALVIMHGDHDQHYLIGQQRVRYLLYTSLSRNPCSCPNNTETFALPINTPTLLTFPSMVVSTTSVILSSILDL